MTIYQDWKANRTHHTPYLIKLFEAYFFLEEAIKFYEGHELFEKEKTILDQAFPGYFIEQH